MWAQTRIKKQILFIKDNFSPSSHLFFLSFCRGPVSPHTSMEMCLMTLLELRDSRHTTAAYKNSVPNKQWTALKSHLQYLPQRTKRRRKTLPGRKTKNKTLIWNILKKKKCNNKYSLSPPRVMVQHLSSFIETSHTDFMVHLKDDCVTNFRKYSIRPWKYIIFDNGCYYYRRYDIVIVILSWTVCVCVCCFCLELLSYLTWGAL